MGLNVTGLMAGLNALKDLADVSDNVIDNTLEEIAFEILKEAKKKAPVDTGFLQNSGRVEKISGGFRVVFKAEYALPVHERTEVSHTNGEAKFLRNGAQVVLSEEKASEILLRRLLD